MLTIPKILDTPEFYDAPLSYKWKDSSAEFYYVDAKNDKVYEGIAKLNYKATLGMATALCEWVYWRVLNHTETPEPLAKVGIESLWASVVDKQYSFTWHYGSGKYQTDPANGAMYAMLKCIGGSIASYHTGNSVFKDIDHLAMLARHIAPDQSFFDQWFKRTLEKATELFPFVETENNPASKYDCSLEPVVPREFFFDPDYDYETADNVKLINNFLSSIDYENNKALNNPKKMIEQGFQGTPYKYEPK